MRRILNKNWNLINVPVLLKPWHPLFDASRERVDVSPIWVRLPGLPLHFWKPYHFKGIGDILGTFLEADMSYLETLDQSVARILVSINLREGLAEQINLDWGPVIIPQLLDYENVSFRCRRCYVYGHPASECNMPPRHHHRGRTPCPRSSEGGSKEKGSGSSDFVTTTSDDQDSDPTDVLGNAGRVMVESSGAQAVRETSLQREDTSQGCPVLEEHPEVPLDLVLSPQVDAASRGSFNPGTSSFSLTPTVNLFLNSVSILGHDWIEGLQKLSLAGPSGFVESRSCPSNEVKASSGQIPPLINSAVVLMDERATALAVPPLVMIDPDPGESLDVGSPTPSESLDSGYFLRSCKNASSVGLGKTSPPGRKGRGRKSNLYKAQSRARVDLMEGKQQSIEKALRAVNAKKRGRK